VYFTLQPGGAFIDGDPAQAVTITYPNPTHLTANAPMDFWNYDPHTGWKIYGRGHVSADGKQVVADAGVGYRELMSFGFGSAPAPTFDSKLNGGSNGADPVDLSTGLFTYTRTDLSINDVIPISLTWHYQQSESSVGDVGMGTHLSYGARIYEKSTSEWDVLLPDGTKVPFTDNVVTKVDNQGQTYLASGQCLQVPGQFFGATITMVLNPAYSHQSQYKLTFRDKSAWLFDTQTPVPLVEIDDANGNAVKLNWADANGTDYYSVVQPRPNRIFLSKVTSPSGRFITFTYPNLGDVNQTLQSAQDNTGRQVQYTYKTFATGGPQYLSTIIEPDQIAKSSPKPVTFAWYSTDPTIRFKSVTDKLKNTRLLNHYDTIGRVQQQDMALEPGMTVTPTWIFNYTGGANLGDTATQLTLTNPRGYNTVYKFDSSGYVTEQDVGANVTAPYHQLVYTFTRDPINHSVVSMKDPLQRVTSYGYDDRGNVNLVTRLVNNSAETVSTQLVYDPNLGRLTSLRNEVQQTTNFDYDSLGNLVGITDPLGRLTQFNNNSLGLPTQIIDPSNHSTTLGYKLADLASVRDPLGRTVTYTTDELGRRDSVTDTAGNETLIGYDALDNEITLTDPLKNTTQLQRDGEGNLQNLTLAGHTNPYVYGYDAYGRVATVTDPLTRGSSSQYDGNGNRTQYIDFKSQTTLYNYDPFDRLHQVTYKDGSTTTYTYDDGNRLTQVVDSLYGTTTITPDDYDHVSSVAGRYGQPVGYQIDSIGRTSTMTYPSGLKVSYQYYADNRLNTMTLVSSGETFTAAYLANGRLDTLKLPNKSMRTHLYNEPGDQLTSITYTDANSAVLGAWTYGYDANTGRLQSMSDSFPLSVNVAGSALTTTPFDDANEITGIGSTSLSHDLNGSQTSDIGLTFKYDARGRLVQAVKGTLTTNFEINPFGLRDRKYASNSTETRFVYDLRGHLIAELDKNNATITEYIWFGNMPVMVRNANAGVMNEFYIFSDNLDTPRRVIVPSTNAARWIWNSDAYGNGVPNGNPNGIGGYSFHLRFPGQFADSETGLFYNSARNYNPATGRYIESDPIGFFAALNQYGYASGNPISTDDPLGLYPAILVYLPDGSFYIPLTQVKNAAQASSYGLPIGWLTAIAVPPGVNPQAQVNFWASTYNNGLGAFASYWWPGGPNDYKLQNAMYDAYGNFAYGATGAAAGYSCNTLTGVADALHRGHNNPINTRDITLGYSAISRGGSLSIIDYTPSKP
jgi:RHS repeat-associated protein